MVSSYKNVTLAAPTQPPYDCSDFQQEKHKLKIYVPRGTPDAANEI